MIWSALESASRQLPQENYAESDSTHRGRHFLPLYAHQLAKLNSKKVRAGLGDFGNFDYFGSKNTQN
jgi:hypothetical protein